MKTAMHKLIETLESQGLEMFGIEEFLEKEKQQIIDAVTYGNRMEFYDGSEMAGEQYFNEIFKKEKL